MNPADQPVFLLGRDSHKAAFDGLNLAMCDAVMLPCVVSQAFGVSLGIRLESVQEAINRYGSKVRLDPILQHLPRNLTATARFAGF
jgi:arginine/lysine/ornithine decarboxylase